MIHRDPRISLLNHAATDSARDPIPKSWFESGFHIEVDRTAEQLRQLPFQPHESEQARRLPTEAHEQIDVAPCRRFAPRHRAEDGEGLHTVRVRQLRHGGAKKLPDAAEI